MGLGLCRPLVLQVGIGISSTLAVLLLDEPFSALDASTRQQVQSALFDQIQADGGYGILVTHHSEDRPPDGECVCLTPFSSGG